MIFKEKEKMAREKLSQSEIDGVQYEATVYADAPEADYETAPQAYTITREIVDETKAYTLRIARGGGFAISLREIL